MSDVDRKGRWESGKGRMGKQAGVGDGGRRLRLKVGCAGCGGAGSGFLAVPCWDEGARGWVSAGARW